MMPESRGVFEMRRYNDKGLDVNLILKVIFIRDFFCSMKHFNLEFG